VDTHPCNILVVQKSGLSSGSGKDAEAGTPLLVARCSSSVHGSNLEVDCAAARATVNSCSARPSTLTPGIRCP
jgi:hypothetical protein